jgi:hypothetical protein
MKKLLLLSATLAAAASFLIPLAALAATPSLSLSATGSGDQVQVNVTGDPNASVVLFAGGQANVLGTTNTSGTFSTTVSSVTYNIAANAAVYVKTGGINGTQSSTTTWPYFQSSSSSNTLTFSQTAVLLNPGQTSTITASTSSLYLLSNTNPATANVNLNANQITVTANTYGTTVATICATGTTTNCPSISVTVQTSSNQQLSFSPNNFSLVFGQSTQVTVSGGSGSYTISNNSNASAVQASISGSTVTLSAANSTSSGAAAITVCTTDLTQCGIINTNATTVNSSAITFSQNNPAAPLGQSTTVTIYGGILGNNFYIASNSNPSVVQANISGNILTLIANTSSGNTTLSICAFAGSCGTVTVTASAGGTTNGALALSQTSLSILAGQSSNITISGGSAPYTISPSANSSNIFNGSVSGNILTIYGVNPGSGTVSICASIGCTTLSVTINSVTGTTSTIPTFNQNNILLNVGSQATVYVSGGGSFYVASISDSNIIALSLNGSTITVTANASGAANAQICQNGGGCATLYATVSIPTTTTTPPPTTTTTVTPYVFPRYLGYGDTGADVLNLQKILVTLKFLKATPTGHYGPATVVAVKAFQKVYKISQTGDVGPSTKTALNSLNFPIAALQ